LCFSFFAWVGEASVICGRGVDDGIAAVTATSGSGAALATE
jgi:hypothetical protein